MLLGNHWGPGGLGRICVRCLCNEVSIQSQSKFPVVNSSVSYTVCSPNRVLALVPTTALSTQRTSGYSSHQGQPLIPEP